MDREAAVREVAFILRERSLAPGFYASIVEDLSRRVARGCSGPILVIMADTGTLTQAVAADVAIVATDPLLNSVERCVRKPGMSRVTWQRADPGALSFREDGFGTVICLLGMATIANRLDALKEVRRVLRPDGRFLFAVPAHIRHMAIAACMQDALAIRFDANPRGC